MEQKWHGLESKGLHPGPDSVPSCVELQAALHSLRCFCSRSCGQKTDSLSFMKRDLRIEFLRKHNNLRFCKENHTYIILMILTNNTQTQLCGHCTGVFLQDSALEFQLHECQPSVYVHAVTIFPQYHFLCFKERWYIILKGQIGDKVHDLNMF